MIFFLMFLISVDLKKQQVLGWTGSREKLMTSQEEGLMSHTENWPGVNPNQQRQQHFIICKREDTMLLFSSTPPTAWVASDPVHKYIAVRTVKTPWDHVWLSAESGAATSVLLTTATTHPGRPPPPQRELFFTFGTTGMSSEWILSKCSH